jgi:putative endopeptidase
MRKFAVTLGALALASCVAPPNAPVTQSEAPRPMLGTWGFELAGMDQSVKPGDDFYQYANGNWVAATEIPPDRARIGSFDNLAILSEKRMLEIVTELESRSDEDLGPEERQLRDLYDGFVDTAGIEARGLQPAKKGLDYFAALKTKADVARAMGSVGSGADSIFGTGVTPDAKKSTAYVMTATQAGLGLPDRDYYLRDDKALATTREAYRKYLITMLTLVGVKDAEKRAGAVFALETGIAEAHWPASERRNADKTYNPMTIAALDEFAPGFAWEVFFEAQGLEPMGPAGARKIIVRENTAFPALAKLFAATPVAVWRDYLTLHYLHSRAPLLPASFDAADFEFYGKVLAGQAQQLPRATRGVRLLDARLGHPLGKIYAAKYFPPASKAKMEVLVTNLLRAYDADIRTLTWMTETTKAKALEKLHAFTPHIGYTDKWRDYSGLAISRDDLIGNIQRSDAFEWQYRLARIDEPVDRNEWRMTPPTVNAYYTPLFNSIFFPAAILQPPFFDPNADDAVNYGGIGVIIGHEISHGFDDQGSKYTGAGILESWWTEADRKAFEARTAVLGAQFDSYEGLPGLKVNGKLTMGENIADLAGLSIALKAYRISLGEKRARVLDGFTGDQRFFLASAQVWRSKYREARMRQQILSDPHSPPQFRVVGPMRNVDQWYSAFGVKPGDKYYLEPDARVRLW